jgi:hypothetical protein
MTGELNSQIYYTCVPNGMILILKYLRSNLIVHFIFVCKICFNLFAFEGEISLVEYIYVLTFFTVNPPPFYQGLLVAYTACPRTACHRKQASAELPTAKESRR